MVQISAWSPRCPYRLWKAGKVNMVWNIEDMLQLRRVSRMTTRHEREGYLLPKFESPVRPGPTKASRGWPSSPMTEVVFDIVFDVLQ
jgi:hypothetical protein